MRYRLASYLTIAGCSEQKYQCKMLCSDDEPNVDLMTIDYVYDHETKGLFHVSSTPETLMDLIRKKHEKEQVREIFDILHVLQTNQCEDMNICFQKVVEQEIIFTLAGFDHIRVKYKANEFSLWDSIRGFYMVKDLNGRLLKFGQDLLEHPKVRLKLLMN